MRNSEWKYHEIPEEDGVYFWREDEQKDKNKIVIVQYGEVYNSDGFFMSLLGGEWKKMPISAPKTDLTLLAERKPEYIWALENRAIIQPGSFRDEKFWMVMIPPNEGCVSTGETPYEAIRKAMKLHGA